MKNLIKLSMLLALSLLIIGCGSQNAQEEEVKPLSFTEEIEVAHDKAAFLAEDVIEFDLVLTFRGSERLNGRLTLSTDSQNGIISEKNGDELYYNGDQVFYQDNDSINTEKLRFKAYTWSYFFLFPYKLSDPGTIWDSYDDKELNSDMYDVEKLTFEAGTGDAPDDWYIVYSDTNTHLIQVAAYIVTASKSQEEAEEDPHAIQYSDYRSVNGVSIAHAWTFWGWKDGELTEEIGSAVISNVTFLKKNERSFEAPEGFVGI